MALRLEFEKIINGWNTNKSLTDIPSRLKKIQKLGELSEEEQRIVYFMQDVQATREYVRKQKEVDEGSE